MVSRLNFLIAANGALQGRMSSYGSDVAGLLTEARLWSSSHSDRSDWTVASRTVAVKLLYLAHLRQEYSQYEEYRSVLGDLPITVDAFDRWWSVTPLFIDEDFDDVATRLDPAVVARIGKTGTRVVDEWIEELRLPHKG